MKLIHYAFLVLFSITLNGAEGTGSHGTGGVGDLDNVWFLGDLPVDYCIEIEMSSRAEAATIKNLVHSAFHDWKEFFVSYQLDKVALGDSSSSLKFKDGTARKMVLDFNQITKCEQRNDMIRFVFSENPPVSPGFETNPGFYLGSAIRNKWNSDTYRTGGIVWIYYRKKPQVYEVQKIKHLILHELGHVFGMRHNEVWVMDENIVNTVLSQSTNEHLGKIESPSWKYRFNPGDKLTLDSDNEIEESASEQMAEEIGLKNLNGSLGLKYDWLDLNGERNITLYFNKGEQILSGKLNRAEKPLSPVGPSIFTEWVSNISTLVGFDNGPASFPAEGFVEYNRVVFPVNIDYKSGPSVKIFFPKTMRWMNYH